MSEAEVKAPIGSVEGRPGVVVVTQDNFNDYVNQELGPSKANPDPEAEAQAEFEALEAAKEAAKVVEPKEGDTEGPNVYFKGKWVKKHDFNYRLHVKTEEAKAELKADMEKTAAEAKAAKEEAAKAAKERDELKQKYEPPPSLEVGPEPDASKYTDIAEYSKARDEWAVSKYRADEAKKQAEQSQRDAAEKQAKKWADSEAALRLEIPDYSERLANAAGASIGVSNELKDAIVDSDIGPKLRLHLAENPDVLKDLLKMPVGRMLKKVGQIEDALGKPKEAKTEEKTPLVEVQISKAPEPISPVKGGSLPGTGNVVDSSGNVVGGYEAYKAARLAGKIK